MGVRFVSGGDRIIIERYQQMVASGLLGRDDRAIAHRHFADLPSLLRPGDLLVFNDAKVIPARFMLRKVTEPKTMTWDMFMRELLVNTPSRALTRLIGRL